MLDPISGGGGGVSLILQSSVYLIYDKDIYQVSLCGGSGAVV